MHHNKIKREMNNIGTFVLNKTHVVIIQKNINHG